MTDRASAGSGTVRFRENCFVRSRPSAAGAVLGLAKRGDALPCAGPAAVNGWLPVLCRGVPGWVSGKYGKRDGATDG